MAVDNKLQIGKEADMRWTVVGTDERIVKDTEGNYIAIAATPELATAIVNLFNSDQEFEEMLSEVFLPAPVPTSHWITKSPEELRREVNRQMKERQV